MTFTPATDLTIPTRAAGDPDPAGDINKIKAAVAELRTAGLAVVIDEVVSRPGLLIPRGALDNWTSRRDTAASDNPGIAFFSCSDTEPTTTGPESYPWPQRVLERLVSAGYNVGGPGWLGLPSNGGTLQRSQLWNALYGEVIIARQGFPMVGDVSDPLTAGFARMVYSTTTGDFITVKNPGNGTRLWYVRAADNGQFAYKVNNGTAITVDARPAAQPVQPALTGGSWSLSWVWVSHSPGDQITVTNLGGGTSGAVRVSFDLVSTTGVEVWNHAISGGDYTDYFEPANPLSTSGQTWSATTGNLAAAQILGLEQGGSTNNVLGSNLGVGLRPEFMLPTSRANARKPALAVNHYGANDVARTRTERQWAASMHLFVRMARNAGADPVISVPPLHHISNNGGDPINAGAFLEAQAGVAMAHGAVLYNSAYAFHPYGAEAYSDQPSVHMTAAGSMILGDDFYEKVVAVPKRPTVDLTRPSQPTGLTISTAATTRSVGLTWIAPVGVTDIAHYEIVDTSSTYFTVYGRTLGAQTTLNVAGTLSAGTYTLGVRAVDSAGNRGVLSTGISVTIPAGSDTTAPTTPGSLTVASKTDVQAVFTFTASTDNVGVTGYEVFINGSSTPTQTLAAGATGFTLTGLTASTGYTVTVKAKDAAGNRSVAASVTFTTNATVVSNVISDDFNRADTTTTLGSTSVGSKPWTVGGATNAAHRLHISNNTAAATGFAQETTTELEWGYVECGSPDGTVSFKIAAAGMGLLLHWEDANNFIYAAAAVSDSLYIKRFTAGSFNFITSISVPTLAVGSTVSVAMAGTSFQFKVNGANVGSAVTITQHATGTKHGLVGQAANAAADDWSYTP